MVYYHILVRCCIIINNRLLIKGERDRGVKMMTKELTESKHCVE